MLELIVSCITEGHSKRNKKKQMTEIINPELYGTTSKTNSLHHVRIHEAVKTLKQHNKSEFAPITLDPLYCDFNLTVSGVRDFVR